MTITTFFGFVDKVLVVVLLGMLATSRAWGSVLVLLLLEGARAIFDMRRRWEIEDAAIARVTRARDAMIKFDQRERL
jgi:hypothetical protein